MTPPSIDLIVKTSKVHVNSETPVIKLLGIDFDPLLNFNFHLKSTSSKIAKSFFSDRQEFIN
jgi:hypothetical protein